MFNFKATINAATTTTVQKFKHDCFVKFHFCYKYYISKNLNLLDNNLTFIH